MEIKNIHMTDEYAANYLLQQGYLAARIEALQAIRDAQKEEISGNENGN